MLLHTRPSLYTVAGLVSAGAMHVDLQSVAVSLRNKPVDKISSGINATQCTL